MPTPKLFFESPSAKALEDQIARAGRSQVPVLIYGHTGSGKEGVARRLHELSPRRGGELIVVPCNAIPEERFEAEFFGWVRGSFPGAHNHIGYFGQADGGTLFLDEVDKLSMSHQQRVLRALNDDGSYRRIGDKDEQRSDVRIVAATNQDLLAMCRERRFLQDLYARIAYLPLRIPATSERREDVAAAARDEALARMQDGLGAGLDDSPHARERVAEAIAAAAAELCTEPGAWRLGFRGVRGFAAQALFLGIEEAIAVCQHRWRELGRASTALEQAPALPVASDSSTRRESRPTPRCGASAPADKEFPIDPLAGLIRSVLHNPKARKPCAGSRPEESLALAGVLAHGGVVRREDIARALPKHKARTVTKALIRLEEAHIVARDGDIVSLRWPLIEIRLLRRSPPGAAEGTWALITPCVPVHVRTGERFEIRVHTRLPAILDISLFTHRSARTTSVPEQTLRAAPPDRQSFISDHALEPNEIFRKDLELTPPGGFEQLLIHLAWPSAHRGARIVQPEHAPIELPSTEDLESTRADERRALGPGWLQEYWLAHS